MTKRTIILFAILLLVAGGAAYTLWPTLDESAKAPEPPTAHEGGPAVHPVSLPALMEQEFDGGDFALGRVIEENSAYTRSAVTYRGGGLTLSGVINIPKGNGPFPVVVTNHGYIDTDVYTSGRGLMREEDALARAGYVVLHPDYRNHAGSDDDPENELQFRLGYTEDVINAILSLRSSGLPAVDAGTVGMLGHSMGGGVTLNLLVTKPELVKAAVLFAPVSANAQDNFHQWTIQNTELAERVLAEYGDPVTEPEFWANVSPSTFLSRVTAPVAIHHGLSDESVPFEWSQELADALEQEGKTVTFYSYDNEGHEFGPAWSIAMGRAIEMFDKELRD